MAEDSFAAKSDMDAHTEGEYRLSIKEMAPEERPRERLEHQGAGSLTPAELVAILLNTGVKGEPVLMMSQRILRDNGGLTGLMRMEHAELSRIKGLGPAKAAHLKAALEIGRRIAMSPIQAKPKIGSPEDIVLMLGAEMMSLEREQLRLLILDTKHRIEQVVTVYQGTSSSAQVRMSELFTPAVRRNAAAIVLVHNHPSGDPTPSSADVTLTRDAVAAGKLLEIPVLDHIIIGQGRHSSLKRLGLGFDRKDN